MKECPPAFNSIYEQSLHVNSSYDDSDNAGDDNSLLDSPPAFSPESIEGLDDLPIFRFSIP